MALGQRLQLASAGVLLLLALLPWPAQAGTQEAPEITDPADDHELLIVPVGEAGQFVSADILAAWLNETASDLLVNILIQGAGTTSTTTEYSWNVGLTVASTPHEASATSTADQPTPGGEATAASRDGSVITITLSKSALGVATGAAITGIAVTSEGNLLETGALVVTDTAPDGGTAAGASYTVTGGSGAATGNGTAGDADGDGLNDTWETEHFGDTAAHNGTGDPDGDGLNNTAEAARGTNPAKADTDGDGLRDGADAYPLDPRRPNMSDAGNTTDSDGDGLPDNWERQHFANLTRQDGGGDPDSDTLSNADELALGTDPNKADTDGDGVDDAADGAPLDPDAAGGSEVGRKARPELYAGSAMFAIAATFILLGLARGI